MTGGVAEVEPKVSAEAVAAATEAVTAVTPATVPPRIPMFGSAMTAVPSMRRQNNVSRSE
jgi:hypothetical protein